jgi:ribonuclease HI
MPTFTCQQCGTSFTLPPAVLAKYPNWTPRTCADCRSRKPASAPAPAAGPRAAVAARPASAPRSITATTNIGPAAVLERFTAGPQDGVFTDGSCQGNPGPGGWGAVRVSANRILDERHGFEPRTTNNRMELTAMIAGLEMVVPDAEAVIYSDSALVVNTLTQWAKGWEARGWKRKEGEVKNLDLVQQAWTLVKERPRVRLQWIRAHDGSRWNEYADALSTSHLRAEP